MAIRIVRLGSARAADEGLRLGTVRRPPRGVRKTELASRDFYDLWLPTLAPSEPLLKQARASRGDEKSWADFERKFRAEMKTPDAKRLLDLLAAFSREVNFSLGCYCRDEKRCHRSILRRLLEDRGAEMADQPPLPVRG